LPIYLFNSNVKFATKIKAINNIIFIIIKKIFILPGKYSWSITR
jgi:hypothetical protein